MTRTLLISVNAKERDYLIRVLREEETRWITAAEARERVRGFRDTQKQSEFVLDAKSRAAQATLMAIRVQTAKTRRQLDADR